VASAATIRRLGLSCLALIAAGAAAAAPPPEASRRAPVVGVRGDVGCGPDAKAAQRLLITEPGVYENLLVDGKWVAKNLVKIRADGVTLRRCEIRNGRHNAVAVYASKVTIDSCRIHHLLAGTFKDQHDAHGITGQATDVVIRNCEIYQVSGDAVQFDPGRGPWDNVLVENCTFWIAPLEADAVGFKKGERPGENAVDTKQQESNPRSRMTIRNCLFYGWGDGQIANQAALNLKDHVQVTVEGCVFRDNDICFRLRGDTGERGGALVTIRDCAVYRSKIAVRMEDRIRDLKMLRLGIGPGIGRKYTVAGGKPVDLVSEGEYPAPAYEKAVAEGLGSPPDHGVGLRAASGSEGSR